MNRSLYTLAFLALSISAAIAGSSEKFIKSKPEKVTVYMSGAQVFRTADLNLPAGQTQIIIEGLEANIDQQSVQAGGKGNFIITGVQYNVHYPALQNYKATAGADAKYTKLIKQINDSIISLDFDLKEIYVKKEVLNTEKSVLLGNRLYKGESKKDSLELLKNGLIFLREKLMNINLELLKMEKQELSINQKKEKLNNRLAEIQSDISAQSYPVAEPEKIDYQIVIDVIADAATPASINVNYYVASAGWTPVYDLRTEGVESPVKLTYKALVHQNTGADWKDVRLTLSTGNPHQSFTIPTLNTWWLGQYDNERKKYKKAAYETDDEKMTLSKGDVYNTPTNAGPASVMKEAEWNTSYTTMTDNFVQAEFEIKLPYTIPSDNKTHIVAVMNKELPTKYVYKAVPKLDMNAYLTARVTGWEDMNLLPGQATLFFAGTYVGQTYLNSVETNDTLSLTLGQDKSIVIKREKQKDKIKEKILDNDKLYTFAYEILVKNGNAKNIEIEVQDQLPLSNNKQVVIQKENISGADFNENTGVLTWKNSIKAKDNKKINFSYTIKAPKEMPVAVR
ncbi:MAG TPA: mucoidy inhibitor MuiA family protein [Bacteroidia bacterium]